jgi:hypothetical protein
MSVPKPAAPSDTNLIEVPIHCLDYRFPVVTKNHLHRLRHRGFIKRDLNILQEYVATPQVADRPPSKKCRSELTVMENHSIREVQDLFTRI